MKALALIAVTTGLLAGCTTGTNAQPSPPMATSMATDPSCAGFTDYQGSAGTVVTFLVSAEMQAADAPLESTWADFARCTGIRIVNQIDETGSIDDLNARLDSGNAPDLMAVAQPGAIADLVHHEAAPDRMAPVPVAPAVADNVDKYWNPVWRQYGTVDGGLYASPFGANVKSLVWYSPHRFAENGYVVPKTWDQLMQLSDRISKRGDGSRPWCGGIEDGSATGWPATDWLEETVLGSFGGDTYDAWVNHKLHFDSPEIRRSMDTLARWMRNPTYVNGGWGDVASIARTPFQDAGRPILSGTCWMLTLPSFYTAFWASVAPGTTVAPDGDVFAFGLPSVNPEIPTSLIGGGEFIVSFSDRPEVQKAHAYLSSPDWATRRARLNTWVSANSGVPLNTYTNPVSRLAAELLTTPAATFRFDGSDLMPGQVGAEEWRQLTAWFADGKPTGDVLKAIDAAWTDIPTASPSP